MADITARIEQILRDNDMQDSAGYFAELLVSELGLEPSYVTGWMGPSGMVRVTPPMMGEARPEEPAKRYVRWGTTKWFADE